MTGPAEHAGAQDVSVTHYYFTAGFRVGMHHAARSPAATTRGRNSPASSKKTGLFSLVGMVGYFVVTPCGSPRFSAGALATHSPRTASHS